MSTEDKIRERRYIETRKTNILGVAALAISIAALFAMGYGLIALQGELATISSGMEIIEAEVDNLSYDVKALSITEKGSTEEQTPGGGLSGELNPAVEYTLRLSITGLVGVGGDIDGIRNPTLSAKVGDVVKVVLINDEDVEHDFVVEDLGVRSSLLRNEGDTTSVTFTTNKGGEFTYQCTLPGHRAAGMEGKLIVSGGDYTEETPQEPASLADIVRDAADLPTPISRGQPERVVILLETREVVGELADGVTYT